MIERAVRLSLVSVVVLAAIYIIPVFYHAYQVQQALDAAAEYAATQHSDVAVSRFFVQKLDEFDVRRRLEKSMPAHSIARGVVVNRSSREVRLRFIYTENANMPLIGGLSKDFTFEKVATHPVR